MKKRITYRKPAARAVVSLAPLPDFTHDPELTRLIAGIVVGASLLALDIGLLAFALVMP